MTRYKFHQHFMSSILKLQSVLTSLSVFLQCVFVFFWWKELNLWKTNIQLLVKFTTFIALKNKEFSSFSNHLFMRMCVPLLILLRSPYVKFITIFCTA